MIYHINQFTVSHCLDFIILFFLIAQMVLISHFTNVNLLLCVVSDNINADRCYVDINK